MRVILLLVKYSVIICAAFTFSACSDILPKKHVNNISNWGSFDLAYQSFGKIKVNKTTIIELKKLGFDPYESTNVAVENYLNIRTRFDPNNLGIMLPAKVQECLSALDDCKAYVATIGFSKENRVGNPFLDIAGFHKETHIIAWNFQAIFIIKEDLVIYKLWAGKPNQKQIIHETTPLGPLQDVSGFITGLLSALIIF